MALINLPYCNGAAAAQVLVRYDDVAHNIFSGATTGPCGPSGLPSGILLYTQNTPTTRYEVYTQNTAPYAYVTAVPIPACSVVIDSYVLGNASTNESNDGSINIAASGPYPKQYSINDGLNYQPSSQFLNLPAGVYNIRVRSQHPGTLEYCYDTDVVEIEFNAIVCHLELGNITVIKPTTLGGSDGSITINTLVNPPGFQVEYRLDAGAWQDSPVFTGLTAAVYNVQVRYKDYTGCNNSRSVTLVDDESCDIFIQTVNITHEQTRFGDDGALEIIATSSNGPIEYSIDNGANYQSGNIFQDLQPGIYTVRVKDAADCEDAQVVQVFQWKPQAFIEIPIVNSHRFVITSAPGLNNTYQNFDNTLFKDMRFPGVERGCYHQKVLLGMSTKTQFLSNYSAHTLKIYSEGNDVLVSVATPQKVKTFSQQEDSRPALYVDAGSGKTQIFFETGLPPWAVIGNVVTNSETGHGSLDDSFEITDIRPGVLAAAGYVALIIDVAFPTTGIVLGTAAAIYDIEPFDVWEFVVNWSTLPAGKYYMKLEGTDPQFGPFTAISEPVDLAAEHPDCVHFDYWKVDNDQVYYDTGIRHEILVEGVLKWPTFGGTQVNHEESNGRFVKLFENVTRNPELTLEAIPPYLAERLALICSHDHLVVNGVDYGKQDGSVEPEYFDGDALCNAKIKLRQVMQLGENSHDAGDVDTPQTVLSVNGTLLAITP